MSVGASLKETPRHTRLREGQHDDHPGVRLQTHRQPPLPLTPLRSPLTSSRTFARGTGIWSAGHRIIGTHRAHHT